MKHWMFDCKKATQLVSESLDRKLTLYHRLGLSVHLMICKFCSRYKEQLLFLRKISHLYTKNSEDSNDSIQLSPEIGKRIKETMVRFLEKQE